MKRLNRSTHPARPFPERVIQFGEGNFLRGFVDWMIHRLNAAGKFGGRVVAVQPIAQGMAGALNEQDGLYTLVLRGIESGRAVDEREVVESVSRGLNPYAEFDAFLAVARDPNVRYVVSNTTEAGIAFSPADRFDDRPQASFPGKLTRFLFERYDKVGRGDAPGVLLLPCELIERNGDALRAAVLRTADNWRLPAAFRQWVESACAFANTLVDRIVSGHPAAEMPRLTEQLGYEDRLLVAGEPFHLWVIEADRRFAAELPFADVGLNVVWTDNMTPYRERKVRILNGAHTMTVPAAFLAGKDTVGECMEDATIRRFLERGLREEVIPTLDLPRPELERFAASVLERFANPHVRHELLSVTLNSLSKMKARVVPSLVEGVRRGGGGAVPRRLAFAFAGLIAFYRVVEVRDGAAFGSRGGKPYPIRDDAAVVEAFAADWATFDGSPEAAHALVRRVLGRDAWWGQDLSQVPGLVDDVAAGLNRILREGAAAAIAAVA